jgi:acetolactate synthase I/II/III large subunit
MMAKAFGMDSACAENTEDLIKAIKKAQASDKPFLIHAKVLKEENVLPMVAPGTSLSDTIYYPAKKVGKEKVTK